MGSGERQSKGMLALLIQRSSGLKEGTNFDFAESRAVQVSAGDCQSTSPAPAPGVLGARIGAG